MQEPVEEEGKKIFKTNRKKLILLDELREFKIIPPHGGWSLLVDVSALGMDGPTASSRSLKLGKIAATPMVHWGSERSSQYVRIVFANEPTERLRGIRQRFRAALTWRFLMETNGYHPTDERPVSNSPTIDHEVVTERSRG